MRYECHFGGYTHWCDACTPLQAGLFTLNSCLEDCKTFPQIPIHVVNLESGREEMVGLADVLWVKHHAAQPLPEKFSSEQAEIDAETQWFENELP